MPEVSTVLLAISDDTEWSGVRSLLADEYGYRVLIAHSTKKALDLTEEANIDLIICEAALEGKDALDVLKQCRVDRKSVV